MQTAGRQLPTSSQQVKDVALVKQEERRAATRAAVLDSARQLFGRDGYGATSIDDIAAKAGVAKGAVYHHFPTKAAVFEAVLEAVSGDIMLQVVQATAGMTDFWDALETGNRAFFAACADKEMSRILLHDGPSVLGWAQWREIDQRNFGGLSRQAFAVGIEQGLIAAHDPDKLSRIVLGAVTEAAIDASESDDYQKCAEQHLAIIKAMIIGLAKRH
jgi:AcrR family transcriptional regulator